MGQQTLWTVLFWVVIAARWVLHLILAGKSARAGPRDVITAVLLVIYLGLGTTALVSGTAGPTAVAAVVISLLIRSFALLALRENFDYSAHRRGESRPLAGGVFEIHRNPLLLGYWCELAGFSLCLPLSPISIGLIVITSGVLCAWHAHEDNNQLTASIAAYPAYRDSTSNFPLTLVIPERARIFDSARLHVDTFGAYAFCALLIGQLVAMSFGVPPGLALVVIPAACLGALTYWKVTTNQKKIRVGFSFFGGLCGATLAGAGFLAWHNQITPAILAAIAFGIAVGHPFGRIGCIAHGCCTGSPTDSRERYSIAYRDPMQRINRIHDTAQISCTPTVVLEALGQLGLALACSLWVHLSLPIWLIGYGSLRTVVQSLRAESGDLTRVAPSAILLVLGCALTTYTPEAGRMASAAPAPFAIGIAVITALASGALFGVRINSNVAPSSMNPIPGGRPEPVTQ